MAEYVSTLCACNLIGIAYTCSEKLNSRYKIRFKRSLSYKLWNLDDINAILNERKEKTNPPKGWLRITDAANVLGWSEPVSRSIMLAHGLRPERFNLYRPKSHGFYPTPCWNEKAVKDIAKECHKRKRYAPPEGWLTFADCMDYLDMNKERTAYWLRVGQVGFKRVAANRKHYSEDDVVALRKAIRNPIKDQKPYGRKR
jgi:hypothetical protein